MTDLRHPIYLVLLGAPGAGKGTQAAFLSEDLGLVHVASGDLFREALSKETKLGKLAKSYMDRGELVPDDVTIAMVMERLGKPDCAAGVVLDGFPRTVEQALALESALGANGNAIDLVPYIKVSEAILLARLAGRWTCKRCGAIFHQLFSPPRNAGVCDECDGELFQRADDTPETQRHRIHVYFEQTAPLIDFFRGRGLLIEIDGEQSIEDVWHSLLAAVGNLRSGGTV